VRLPVSNSNADCGGAHGLTKGGTSVAGLACLPSAAGREVSPTQSKGLSREALAQDSRTNCWARWREGGFSVENALSAQCGIGIAFPWDAAARQASPGFGVCNHRESGT
jgi:hypothetical protein